MDSEHRLRIAYIILVKEFLGRKKNPEKVEKNCYQGRKKFLTGREKNSYLAGNFFLTQGKNRSIFGRFIFQPVIK